MVVSGRNHIIIQNEKNEIYACGWNMCGQLGLGDYYDRDKFEKVECDFRKIKKIACGEYHTIIQNEINGKDAICVCGNNNHGQLGLGDEKHRNKFEKVGFDFGKIKNIVCGGNHTMIRNEIDGKDAIYVCGYNYHGQLGLGDYEDRYKFEKVEHDFGKIKNMACANSHTIVQNEKNEIYVCGGNYYGQLGLGDCEDRYKFEKVNFDFGEIKDIACGENHIVIQNEKNEIYVCGRNWEGQLGLGDDHDRNKFEKVEYDFGEIKKIACGGFHTIIQNEKNEVYVCGNNYCGQLGLGDYENRNIFEKVEYDFGEIKNIACSGFYIMIQNEKNEVYTCGRNLEDQSWLDNKKNKNRFGEIDTDGIFEKIYNFELKIDVGEIAL